MGPTSANFTNTGVKAKHAEPANIATKGNSCAREAMMGAVVTILELCEGGGGDLSAMSWWVNTPWH